MRQRQIGGAPRRFLSGLVAVETKDRLVRHLPQQRELVFRQRRAERRHAGGQIPRRPWRSRRHSLRPRPAARDYFVQAARTCRRYGVPFAPPRGCRDCRPCETAGFPANSDIWRRHVLFQRTAAERDDAPARVGDRKHHAIAKAIVWHRYVVATESTGRLRPCPRNWNAGGAQMLLQRETFARTARRIADAKLQLRRPAKSRGRRDSRARLAPLREASVSAKNFAARSITSYSVLRRCSCLTASA